MPYKQREKRWCTRRWLGRVWCLKNWLNMDGSELGFVTRKSWRYCWWKKSQTTTWDVKNPANNRINYLSTGAGFIPSTVTQIYMMDELWGSFTTLGGFLKILGSFLLRSLRKWSNLTFAYSGKMGGKNHQLLQEHPLKSWLVLIWTLDKQLQHPPSTGIHI